MHECPCCRMDCAANKACTACMPSPPLLPVPATFSQQTHLRLTTQVQGPQGTHMGIPGLHTPPAALAGSPVRTDTHLDSTRSTPWSMTWTRSGALLLPPMQQRSCIPLLLTGWWSSSEQMYERTGDCIWVPAKLQIEHSLAHDIAVAARFPVAGIT